MAHTSCINVHSNEPYPHKVGASQLCKAQSEGLVARFILFNFTVTKYQN